MTPCLQSGESAFTIDEEAPEVFDRAVGTSRPTANRLRTTCRMKVTREGFAALLLLWGLTTTCFVAPVATSPLPFPDDDFPAVRQEASRRIFGPLDFLPLLARIRNALREGRREQEKPYSLFRFPRLFGTPNVRVKSTEEEIAEYVRDYIRMRVRERQREKNNRTLREGRRALKMLKQQTGNF